MDERNHSPIFCPAEKDFYQSALVDCVEKLFQVSIHRIFIACINIVLGCSQDFMCAAFQAETEPVVAELPFRNRG
jgi:hypothetical protein